MSETKELLRRGVGEFEPMPDAFDRVIARRDRKQRNQRVAAGVLGIAVFALAAIGLVRILGSEQTPADRPTPAPLTSGGMWPQSSLSEVREAQRLADAGDERYAWQVGLVPDEAFFVRFIREELGWDEFRWGDFPGLSAGVVNDRPWEFAVVRCAAGETNPVFPDDPEGSGCAPTLDDGRYETVMIHAEPPLRVDDPTAIWVVTDWTTLRPAEVQVTGTNYLDDSGDSFRRQVQQVVPPSDAEVSALLDAFLQARVDGEGAEGYLAAASTEVPLLYAMSSGAPYERAEFELVRGPVWPGGWRECTLRLFAEGGATVEQTFLVERAEDGRLELAYASLDPFTDVLTIEDGGPLPEPYDFLDGEVTFVAAPPWDWYVGGWGFTPTMTTLMFDDPDQRAGLDQLLAVVADPLPVERGCQQGPAPADAEALAQDIRSDPDLEATEPVTVSVGGFDALRMDVVAAAGASVCPVVPAALVVTTDDGDRTGVALASGHRMRLYLLDLPEGMSERILAIAVTAPEASFEHVIGAAEPIVDSFEFHTR